MAQITVFAKSGITNWDTASPNGWNDQADGLGTDYANPQNGGGNTYICDLNGRVVTLNVDVTVDLIQANGSVAYLDVSGTRIITANVTYTGTSTSGMVRVGTGDNLTINGKVECSNSGYGVRGTGSGIIQITNVGGQAVVSSGLGSGVRWEGTGSCSITGQVVASGANANCIGVYLTAGAGVAAITNSGNVAITASSPAFGVVLYVKTLTVTGDIGVSNSGGYGLRINNGVLNLDGFCQSINQGVTLDVVGGTVNWTGARSLGAGLEAYVQQSGGILNMATASSAIVIANSGTFVLRKTGGTLNTADAGAGAASIVNQTSTSYAAILGGTDANKAIITGPTQFFGARRNTLIGR